MFQSLFIYLLLLSTVLATFSKFHTSKDNVTRGISSNNDDCSTKSLGKSFYCRGTRALRNVIHNLNKSEKPIVIVRGLEIVRSRNISSTNAIEEISNISSGNDTADDTDESFLERFSDYLRTHELNIKFSDLLAEESEHLFEHDLERNGAKTVVTTAKEGGIRNRHIEVARKKDKGQGILMAMALVFGKVMAVLGLGGIGALAMKALGIALTALMMAGILSLKSMSQQNGGHESNHNSVHYLAPETLHKRRRRRSLWHTKNINDGKQEMAYRGW